MLTENTASDTWSPASESHDSPYDVVKGSYTLPFPLYPYQVKSVNNLAPLDRAGYYHDQGCVDSDTEYLSPTGWKKIGEYTGGPVGQYHLDGSVDLVEPEAYVKLPCPAMYRLKTAFGVDQMLSPEHRVLYKEHVTGELKVTSAAELAKTHARLVMGFRGSFITTFDAPVRAGLGLSDAELRLQVALIADGYFPYNPATRENRTCVISIKKERKQSRLVTLLTDAGVEFEMRPKLSVGKEGYMLFTFQAPIKVKEFDARFYECSPSQLAVIADEFMHWDGSVAADGATGFHTTSKTSADFVQFTLASTGVKSSLVHTERTREGRKTSDEYTVLACYKSNLAGISGGGHTKPGRVQLVPSTDGFKYCFTVPTTYLIFRRNGRIFASGNTGKTVTATASTLFKFATDQIDACVVIMPPILLTMWERWLAQIPGLVTVRYSGTPVERANIKISGHFFLVGLQIFKKDYDYLERIFRKARLNIIVDEAHSIKNVASESHKSVRDFAGGRSLMLLSGTPVTQPDDAYAFIKLIAPTVYRNKNQFNNIHVDKVDHFGTVTRWKNLDILAENVKINSDRVLREQVLKDLPPVVYIPLRYELSKKHQKLYNQLAEEQMLRLEGGGKIDATTAQALYHNLQQIVTNFDHFSGNEKDLSAAFEVVDQVIEEMAGRKLVIFGNYRMTNRTLLKRLTKYHAVAAFGDNTAKQNQLSIDRFINDPACQVFIGQPTSVGYGVDGLQRVCNDALFLETPTVPRDFHQAVARLYRGGQTSSTQIRVAVAERTVQVRLHKNLLTKDEMVHTVVGGFKTLRDSIYGA